MIRTAIYLRVSTERQAQEGDSIPAQREALRRYCKEKGYILTGEYLDDGISGTKADRTAYQRMLADVQDRKIDLVICTKLDRLHRGLKNFLTMQEIFDKAGCNWLAIWEPMYDSSTPQGRMIINTMVNLAQFEAENTGQRIRQVFEYKRSKGEVLCGNTPLGYSIVDKHLVPNEDAEKAKKIFQYYVDTGKLYETCRFANSLTESARSHAAILNMLKNTTYIGDHGGNTEFCEPIIDKAVFEDVQRLLKRNVKSSQKHDYIFSGLMVCAECDKKLSGFQPRQKRWTYRCRGYYSKIKVGDRTCANKRCISEPVLERYLVENIKPLAAEYVHSVKTKGIVDNTGRIKSLEKKIERLKELYVNELIDLAEYKRDKADFQEQIEVLLQEEKVETDTTVAEQILAMDFESKYALLDNKEKRTFWRTFIREIRFSVERKIEVIFL